jgi:hypothetical protein
VLLLGESRKWSTHRNRHLGVSFACNCATSQKIGDRVAPGEDGHTCTRNAQKLFCERAGEMCVVLT